MRYVYAATAALLLGGSSLALTTGYTAGAQVAQNDQGAMRAAVPQAGAPLSFADLTEQLQPAVVNISTTQRVRVPNNPFSGTPFDRFFGNRGGGGGDRTREAQSLGSGFIISADGFVVTNNHVVAPGNANASIESITVTMPDGTEYEAELVGRDPESDLAVLKITSSEPFPFVNFGDSTRTRVGDWIIAIGNPFGLGGTVTSGIISAVYRNTGQGGAYDRYLQTDASINRGNSGGPMFDLNGNVIGINNAIISPTGGSVGIGFAIPSEVAEPIVRTLMQGGAIERGYLGVEISSINDDLADSLGIAANRGEFVQRVQPDGAAAAAGIEPGDVIMTINGQDVTPDQNLSFIVANIEPGTRITIDLIRDGRERTVSAILGTRPSAEELAEQNFNPEAMEDFSDQDDQSSQLATREALGLVVTELTPGIARQVGVPADTEGVVIAAVDPSADAATKGLRRGDVILSINNAPTRTSEDVDAAVGQAQSEDREAVLIRFQRRDGRPQFLPVRLRD